MNEQVEFHVPCDKQSVILQTSLDKQSVAPAVVHVVSLVMCHIAVEYRLCGNSMKLIINL